MAPLVFVLVLALFVLPFLLDTLVNAYGFLGSAFAILIFEAGQVVMLLAYLWWHKPHHPESWPGLGSWREALAWDPMKLYLSLGLGGVLSASEWVYWEMIGIMIGILGPLPLAVHTIPNQVIMVAFMVPLGIGIALSIRLGQVLPRSPKKAKQLVFYTYVGSFIVVSFISVWLYIYRDFIFHIFTNEQDVLDGCESIWPQVVFYNWTLSMTAIAMGVSAGLGMQWTLGVVTFVCLWVIGMPALWYFAVYREGGLVVAWNCIYPPYISLNALMCCNFYFADWDAISHSIRIREGIDIDSPCPSAFGSTYGSVDFGLKLNPANNKSSK
jgi:MATE family multidrug resistance protein